MTFNLICLKKYWIFIFMLFTGLYSIAQDQCTIFNTLNTEHKFSEDEVDSLSNMYIEATPKCNLITPEFVGEVIYYHAHKYYDLLKYEKCVVFLNRFKLILKNKYPKANDTYLRKMLSLEAAAYHHMFDWEKSDSLYKLSWKLFQEAKDTTTSFCTMLRGYGIILKKMRHLKESDEVFKNCFDCYRKLDSLDPELSISIRVYGEMLLKENRLNEGLIFIEQAQQINKASDNPSNKFTCYYYFRLIDYYHKVGNQLQVSALRKEVLPLVLKEYGENHYVYKGVKLSSLLDEYKSKNKSKTDVVNFLNTLDESFNSYRKKAATYIKIADALFDDDSLNLALEYTKYADSLYKIKFPNNPIEQTRAKPYFAKYFAGTGFFEKALEYNAMAIDAKAKYYGEFSFELRNYYYNQSRYFLLNNDELSSLKYAKISSDIYKKYILEFGEFISEQDLYNIIKEYENICFQNVAIATQVKTFQEDFIKTSLDDIVFIKGFITERTLKARRLIDLDTDIQNISSELNLLKDDLVQYKISHKQSQINDITRRVDSLERLYHNRMPLCMSECVLNHIDISQSLKSNEVVIEWIRYKVLQDVQNTHVSSNNSFRYAAIICLPNNVLKIVDVCSASSLDTIYKNDTETGFWDEYYHELSDKKLDLFDLLWKPIVSFIPKTVNVIHMSMDGQLHNLNFSAIIDVSGIRLMDLYEFHYYLNTSKIAEKAIHNTNHKSQKESFVIGGIQYQNNYNGTSAWEKLIAATQESVDLQEKLIAQGFKVSYLSGDLATEYNIQKIWNNSEGFNIVHMALHGFYLTDDNKEYCSIPEFLKNVDDPMLTSGLVVSKDSAKLENLFKHDGILTAYEMSQWPLRNVDLMVLSACGTGITFKNDLDGSYGLQRAAKQVGAKKLLVSLDRVSDWHTHEIMTKFYDLYLNEGMNASLALDEAQRYMIGKGYDPIQWATWRLIE